MTPLAPLPSPMPPVAGGARVAVPPFAALLGAAEAVALPGDKPPAIGAPAPAAAPSATGSVETVEHSPAIDTKDTSPREAAAAITIVAKALAPADTAPETDRPVPSSVRDPAPVAREPVRRHDRAAPGKPLPPRLAASAKDEKASVETDVEMPDRLDGSTAEAAAVPIDAPVEQRTPPREPLVPAHVPMLADDSPSSATNASEPFTASPNGGAEIVPPAASLHGSAPRHAPEEPRANDPVEAITTVAEAAPSRAMSPIVNHAVSPAADARPAPPLAFPTVETAQPIPVDRPLQKVVAPVVEYRVAAPIPTFAPDRSLPAVAPLMPSEVDAPLRTFATSPSLTAIAPNTLNLSAARADVAGRVEVALQTFATDRSLPAVAPEAPNLAAASIDVAATLPAAERTAPPAALNDAAPRTAAPERPNGSAVAAPAPAFSPATAADPLAAPAPAIASPPPATVAREARIDPRSPAALPRPAQVAPETPPSPPGDAAPATDRMLRARPNTAFSAGVEVAAIPVTDAPMPLRPVEATPVAAPPIDTGRQEWLTGMIDRIEILASGDAPAGRETRITLSPDALGEVSVRLVETDAGVQIALDAATPEARALLAEAAPRLADMAEARGLRLSAHAGGGESRDGRHHAPPQPEAEAPAPNRRARSGAEPATDDQRIA